MTKKDDMPYEPFSAYERGRWFIRNAHSYHYGEYTEMPDEPRLAHNDSDLADDAGTDDGHKSIDSPD